MCGIVSRSVGFGTSKKLRSTSSLDHPDPTAAGDKQRAWTQPAVPPFR